MNQMKGMFNNRNNNYFYNNDEDGGNGLGWVIWHYQF
jgi:hypothetical protein